MVFARLPWNSAPRPAGPILEREEIHAVPLWEERPVAVVAKDNPLSLSEELTESDLGGEYQFSVGDRGAPQGADAPVPAAGACPLGPNPQAPRRA